MPDKEAVIVGIMTTCRRNGHHLLQRVLLEKVLPFSIEEEEWGVADTMTEEGTEEVEEDRFVEEAGNAMTIDLNDFLNIRLPIDSNRIVPMIEVILTKVATKVEKLRTLIVLPRTDRPPTPVTPDVWRNDLVLKGGVGGPVIVLKGGEGGPLMGKDEDQGDSFLAEAGIRVEVVELKEEEDAILKEVVDEEAVRITEEGGEMVMDEIHTIIVAKSGHLQEGVRLRPNLHNASWDRILVPDLLMTDHQGSMEEEEIPILCEKSQRILQEGTIEETNKGDRFQGIQSAADATPAWAPTLTFHQIGIQKIVLTIGLERGGVTTKASTLWTTKIREPETTTMSLETDHQRIVDLFLQVVGLLHITQPMTVVLQIWN
jgi:hypothetical protein